MIKKMLSNFKRYRFLLKQLIIRDFKVKYKRSVLGVVWSLLYPVLMMIVLSIVFSQMFKFKVEGVNYLVYLMTGIIMWNYFSEATNTAMTSVVSNFSLINKVYMPKYIFPIAKCLFVGINFLLTLIPWIILIFITQFGTEPCYFNWGYLVLPYIFICMLMFTIGISMITSCISVFLRDMFYIYGIILTIWNYLTPVFYSIEMLDESLQSIFTYNPLYLFINSARNIVLFNQIPTLSESLILFLVGFCTMFVGIVIFRKKQDKFIYYV